MRSFCATVLAIALPLMSAVAQPPANEYAVMRKAPIEVFHHPDTEAEATEVLNLLDVALHDFAPQLPAGDKPIRVVIAQSLAEFNRFAPDLSHLDVEGVAHSQSGWIIVKSRRLHRPDSSFPATLRHELVHVLLSRNTAIGNLPRWFNEGLAMKLAGDLQWSAPVRVARMQATGEIIPYAHLDFAFAGDANLVGNAYAQARSMTEYLHDEVGDERFWKLVASLDRQSFDAALQEYASMTPRQFSAAWRNSLWTVALVVSLMSGFTAFQFMALLAVFAYLRKRRQAKQRMAQWEREEAEEDEVFTVRDLEDQDPPYPWEDDDDKF